MKDLDMAAGSRDAMEAGSSDPADLLRAELMAVGPSPRFAAGVRERIAARLTGTSTLWLNSAAAVTVMALIAISVPKDSAQPDLSTAEPVVAVAPASLPAPAAARTTDRLVARRPKPERAIAGLAESRLEVLVPTDQAIAVRRALAVYAAGRQVAAASRTNSRDESTGELQESEPIQIAPVRIEPLLKFEFFWGGRFK